MKYAIVHDDFIQFGGAERVVVSLNDIFKNSDVFSSISSEDNLKLFENFYLSSAQKYSLFKKYSKQLFFIYPYIFESFNFNDYDIVISSSSRFAHGIITQPSTMHICYMHSPSRYIWDYEDYIKEKKLNILERILLPVFKSYLMMWDYAAAQRVDYFIANSSYTKDRIKKFYGKESVVISPPVNIDKYLEIKDTKGKYYLYVGRIVPWKRLDIVIDAFRENGKKLCIVGRGEKEYISLLKSKSSSNIKYIENATDEDLVNIYANSKALIFPSKEDFGIAPVESIASGKPVIAYKEGGVSDSIVDGKNGVLFPTQDKDSLNIAIERLESLDLKSDDIKKTSHKFSAKNFKSNMEKFIDICQKK